MLSAGYIYRLSRAMQEVISEIPAMANPDEVRFMIFASLFGKGSISSGQAASSLNMSRKDFLSGVGKYGISTFSDEEDDLKRAMQISL